MEAAEEVATEAAVDTAEEEVAVVVDMEVAAGEEATAAVAVAEIAVAGVEIAAATGSNKTEWHAHGFAWACNMIS